MPNSPDFSIAQDVEFVMGRFFAMRFVLCLTAGFGAMVERIAPYKSAFSRSGRVESADSHCARENLLVATNLASNTCIGEFHSGKYSFTPHATK